jgi:hypothetical protein
VTRIEKLRQIGETGQAAKIDGILVDIVSAGLLVNIYDAAQLPKTRTIIETLPLPKVMEVAWRVVKK